MYGYIFKKTDGIRNKIRDLFKVKLYIIRSKTKKREREKKKREREKKERKKKKSV